MRTFLASGGLILSIAASAQWLPSGLPGSVLHLYDVVASPTGDTIYAAGSIQYDGPWQDNNPVFMYTDGTWTAMENLNGEVFTLVLYHDTLIVGGNFWLIEDTIPAGSLAYYSSDGWRPYGVVGDGQVIRKLRVIDDTLYAAGGFHSVDGHPAEGVIRREGSQWVSVGAWNVDDAVYAIDIVKYHNTLVTVGLMDFENGRGVSYLNNGEWTLLGPGILGGMSGAVCLAVYHDELYLGGQIALSGGNAGQDIMRWNGQEFLPVDHGVQYNLNVYTGFSEVSSMAVHDDLLFVGGGFRYASGVPANGVAVWDGERWCAPQGDITATNYETHMAFYGDTLFVAGADTADGVFVNYLAKFGGDNYRYTCSPVGVEEERSEEGMQLIPNPTSDVVHLMMPGPTAVGVALRVTDATGRVVQDRAISKAALDLDVSTWRSGIYTVSLMCDNVPFARSRLVVVH